MQRLHLLQQRPARRLPAASGPAAADRSADASESPAPPSHSPPPAPPQIPSPRQSAAGLPHRLIIIDHQHMQQPQMLRRLLPPSRRNPHRRHATSTPDGASSPAPHHPRSTSIPSPLLLLHTILARPPPPRLLLDSRLNIPRISRLSHSTRYPYPHPADSQHSAPTRHRHQLPHYAKAQPSPFDDEILRLHQLCTAAASIRSPIAHRHIIPANLALPLQRPQHDVIAPPTAWPPPHSSPGSHNPFHRLHRHPHRLKRPLHTNLMPSCTGSHHIRQHRTSPPVPSLTPARE